MGSQRNEREMLADNTGHATGMQDSAAIYADNVVFGSRQGHGFAFEKANHEADKWAGKDAHLVGGNNAKNGADRLVDGQLIQSKCCSSGSKCIAETFDKDTGLFRYLDSNGRPMQIEVPSDMYDDAVEALAERIKKGQVPGVKNPAEASNIVRKGRFTYKQACNIAKAGTVEGLAYDAANGVKLAGTAMGITALLTFAVGIWQGKSRNEALDAACFNGICVGGTSLVTSILTAQVGRTGIENTLRTGTDWAVKQLSPKVVEALANAFRNGNNIYGAAAANHVSKLLRGQIAVAAIVTTVLTVDDFIALFSRQISGTQAFKNICKTAVGVASGSAGFWGGAALGAKAGASLGPTGAAVGSVAGGIIGATAGGWSGSKLVNTGLDAVIDDDAIAIGALMERTFGQLAEDYLLSEKEAEEAIADFRVLDMESTVRDIYASDNRENYTYDLMLPFFERVAIQRPPVFRPPKKKIAAATESLIGKLAQAEIVN